MISSYFSNCSFRSYRIGKPRLQAVSARRIAPTGQAMRVMRIYNTYIAYLQSKTRTLRFFKANYAVDVLTICVIDAFCVLRIANRRIWLLCVFCIFACLRIENRRILHICVYHTHFHLIVQNSDKVTPPLYILCWAPHALP